MNLDSKMFYMAQASLNSLHAFKQSFVNDLYNGFICGNNYKDKDPQFIDIDTAELKDSEDKALKKFEDELDYETLENQIQIKAKELAILLEAREEQLKEQYNKYC